MQHADSCAKHFPQPCPGYCPDKGNRLSAVQMDLDIGEQDVNPGPYRAGDGNYYFDLGGQTYGPFSNEEDAEGSFVASLEDFATLSDDEKEAPMLKESDFPTVEDVLAIIAFLPDEVEPDMRESDHDEPSIDVRLQVHENGSWFIHTGDASFDTDHRGFWGASSVSAQDTPEDLRSVAESLIDEAMEGAWEAGFLEQDME